LHCDLVYPDIALLNGLNSLFRDFSTVCLPAAFWLTRQVGFAEVF